MMRLISYRNRLVCSTIEVHFCHFDERENVIRWHEMTWVNFAWQHEQRGTLFLMGNSEIKENVESNVCTPLGMSYKNKTSHKFYWCILSLSGKWLWKEKKKKKNRRKEDCIYLLVGLKKDIMLLNGMDPEPAPPVFPYFPLYLSLTYPC